MERTAVCSCGQLAVTVEGEPAFHGICSCFECQKMSGSAYSYSGYWPKTAVSAMRGESMRRALTRLADRFDEVAVPDHGRYTRRRNP